MEYGRLGVDIFVSCISDFGTLQMGGGICEQLA